MNVQHKVHVNKDFEWTGNDIFDLSEKLGEGCVHAADSRYVGDYPIPRSFAHLCLPALTVLCTRPYSTELMQ